MRHAGLARHVSPVLREWRADAYAFYTRVGFTTRSRLHDAARGHHPALGTFPTLAQARACRAASRCGDWRLGAVSHPISIGNVIRSVLAVYAKRGALVIFGSLAVSLTTAVLDALIRGVPLVSRLSYHRARQWRGSDWDALALFETCKDARGDAWLKKLVLCGQACAVAVILCQIRSWAGRGHWTLPGGDPWADPAHDLERLRSGGCVGAPPGLVALGRSRELVRGNGRRVSPWSLVPSILGPPSAIGTFLRSHPEAIGLRSSCRRHRYFSSRLSRASFGRFTLSCVPRPLSFSYALKGHSEHWPGDDLTRVARLRMPSRAGDACIERNPCAGGVGRYSRRCLTNGAESRLPARFLRRRRLSVVCAGDRPGCRRGGNGVACVIAFWVASAAAWRVDKHLFGLALAYAFAFILVESPILNSPKCLGVNLFRRRLTRTKR